MTKENCHSTYQFINQEFKPLLEGINEKREQTGREKLKLKCWPDVWNPAQKRLADLGEM